MPKRKQRAHETYNTQLLTHDNNKQEEYKEKVQEKLKKGETEKSWDDIKDIIKHTAKEVVGTCKPGFRNHEEYSDKVEQLSKEQKKIRINISNTKDTAKIIDLRKERNRIMKEIKNEIKAIREHNIEEIVKEIEAAPNDMKMYKSIKRLRKPKSKNKNIVIHDCEGKNIINEKEKYQAVKTHFQDQLYDESIMKIEQFIGEPRPLTNKITVDEVKKATVRMNNNKATGEDGIQAELLKYGPDTLIKDIARILNSIFEEHKDVINVGRSILQPIPKPGKPEGPRKNLRPINLLNVIRKVLSLITLNRIKEKVDEHVKHTQAAYRPNRSTTDIIWAHRFICSKVQLYQDTEIIIIGIDMSSAFDTIDRGKLMQELETLLQEDEQRMCRLLLSNTTISIKFGNHDLETVETNIGSPQGDAISGTFFNIEFENALRTLREKMKEARSQVLHTNNKKSSLPTELEYADDSDFPFECKNEAEHLKRIVKETLGERNLKVNDDKTEETFITREKKKSNEKWRKTKKLGSLLGDYEDMRRREQLSNNAMAEVKKIWKKSKVNNKRKLQLYKTLVKPVLTYNYGTWGLTKAETETLNCIHRKQLRRISPGYRSLTNKQLYEECEERELSKDMKDTRWRTFGHILRLPLEAPCQQAMDWYFEIPDNAKKYRGNQRITLPVKLNNDIVEGNNRNDLEVKQFKTRDDLVALRKLARDRDMWKELSKIICSVA